MYYAYVIKSIDHDYLYKGHCENLEKRLSQHNAGLTKSIKPYLPSKLYILKSFKREKKQLEENFTLRLQPGEGF